MGYVPQYKFSHGNTYGRQTAIIAEDLPYYGETSKYGKIYIYPKVGDGKFSATKAVFKDEIPRDRVPIPTGDNCYTQNTIPGYSGAFPKMLNKYGGTYAQLADECIDEFITDYTKRAEDRAKVDEQTKLFPPLQPITDDGSVRNNMDTWVDEYFRKSNRNYGPKGPTDPPTVGYGGHIPKAIAANLSLGCTYGKGATKSLSAFRNEISSHFARLQLPVKPLNKEPERIIPQVFDLNETPISFRIYRNSGMMPNYSGHVHGQAFTGGSTQSEVTRRLEVCSHHYPSYGYYLKNKDLADESSTKGNN